MTFAELQAKIAQRAWEDPAFEAEFMADPKATFEKYTGQTLPAGLAVQAHYNSPTELHFVIPQRPAGSTGELSDEDLERVAGGETALLIYATIMITIGVTTGVSAATAAGEDW